MRKVFISHLILVGLTVIHLFPRHSHFHVIRHLLLSPMPTCFCSRFRQTLGPNNEICTLRLGPVKCYIVSGVQNIQSMSRLSRHLSAEKLECQIMNSVFGLSQQDMDRLLQSAREDGGKASDMGKRNRMFDVEKLYHEFLTTSCGRLPQGNSSRGLARR